MLKPIMSSVLSLSLVLSTYTHVGVSPDIDPFEKYMIPTREKIQQMEREIAVQNKIEEQRLSEQRRLAEISREKQRDKKKAVVSKTSRSGSSVNPPQSGRTINVTATAYTANCKGCSGITYTGIDVRNSTPNIIAVDPKVIPLGSKVEINGKIYTAGDIGGAIKGNKIDILMSNHSDAVDWGIRQITIKILE